MSNGLNKVMLMGNLGADPELKSLNGGQSVLKLNLATTESFKDKNNAWKERTEWHRVTVWGKRAEALAGILSKGATVFVEGSLHTSSYEKNGEKRYSTEINAQNIILAGGKRGADASKSTGGGGSSADSDQGFEGNEDIPFIVNATLFGRWDRP